MSFQTPSDSVAARDDRRAAFLDEVAEAEAERADAPTFEDVEELITELDR